MIETRGAVGLPRPRVAGLIGRCGGCGRASEVDSAGCELWVGLSAVSAWFF